MKRIYQYKAGRKTIKREINYIPFRYLAAAFITLLETLAIIGVVASLCIFVPYFYIAVFATQIFCTINIIVSEDNPDYKVPWLLFVMILPIAGFMLYFLFYSRKLKKKYITRMHDINKQSYQKEDGVLFETLLRQDPVAHNQAKLLCTLSKGHLFNNTKQEYFPLGEDMFTQMLVDLKNAENFIYLEYFIIEEGVFWNSILDILKEKAALGVEVKVVYDDVGCMATLPGNYAKILRSYGIDATPFSRLKGNADSEFNNRNHRKILVIDGTIGYTGGVNLADEYINQRVRFGHWKDVGVRLEGEAVWELTRLFLLDFGINVKDTPTVSSAHFPIAKDVEADGYVIPFGDGPRPVYERTVAKTLIEDMLTSAKRYVYITTPYLIIDSELCTAIENTALKGVQVKIIVPHIPDKKIVFNMTRSFYPRLLNAGVEIYEYEPGFIHAKTYLVDGEYAVIGTVNLDYRSLVHHFENGVWLYRCDCISHVKADIQNTLQQSICITKDMTKITLWKRALRSLVKIFAPLL